MPIDHPNPPNDSVPTAQLASLVGLANWWMNDASLRETPVHQHPEHQLFSLHSGLAVIKTQEGSWTLPPGCIAWMPAGEPHALRSCGKMGGWSIYLQPAQHRMPRKKPAVLSRSALVQEVAARLTARAKPSPAAYSHLVAVLWDELEVATVAPLHLPFPSNPKLRELMQEVARDLTVKRTVSGSARAAGMSERSYLRHFQAETGLTFGRWVQQLRIMVALEKLTLGCTVTETALAVGFHNVSAFIRLFQGVLGSTPTAYMRKRRLG